MSDLNVVQDALPTGGVPSTGIFNAVNNVLNDTFATPSGNTDTPYNGIYIGDTEENIVGSKKTPYLPMALPAYIPTLYENVYHLQKNLKNVIPDTEISDNRDYPTIRAVKEYVNTQLTGFELLTPNADAEEIISTGRTTSFLTASEVTQSENVDAKGESTFVTTYGIKQIDSARNGADKTIINTSNLGVVGNGKTMYMQIVLTGEKQFFIVAGKQYKCYVFSSLGDILNMSQFLRDNGDELFFVKTYGGLFSDAAYY